MISWITNIFFKKKLVGHSGKNKIIQLQHAVGQIKKIISDPKKSRSDMIKKNKAVLATALEEN